MQWETEESLNSQLHMEIAVKVKSRAFWTESWVKLPIACCSIPGSLCLIAPSKDSRMKSSFCLSHKQFYAQCSLFTLVLKFQKEYALKGEKKKKKKTSLGEAVIENWLWKLKRQTTAVRKYLHLLDFYSVHGQISKHIGKLTLSSQVWVHGTTAWRCRLSLAKSSHGLV